MSSISYLNIVCQEIPPGDWPVNEPITYLPSPEQAKQHARIRAIVARAISGDWADNSLDAVCGALLIAGATEDGCWMWRGVIAAGRARLAEAKADKLNVLEIPYYEWEPTYQYFEDEVTA